MISLEVLPYSEIQPSKISILAEEQGKVVKRWIQNQKFPPGLVESADISPCPLLLFQYVFGKVE
jgi:hypothetical protein